MDAAECEEMMEASVSSPTTATTTTTTTTEPQLNSLQERFNQLERLFSIRPTLFEERSINCELLVDLLITVFHDLQKNLKPTRQDKNSSNAKFCNYIRPLVEQIGQWQLKASDFEPLKIIGKGAFGQVSLVKCRATDQIFAMKVLNKLEMSKRAEKACYKEERDILLHGSKLWFTKLHYAFQDTDNLYLVMDYYIGGDFLTLLSKYDDCLPEDMCRFYAAQIILAISSLHDFGYIHRDIKPHNILIDSSGHIRLADFGSCVRASAVNSETSAPIGTPDYISPEILSVIEGRTGGGGSGHQESPYSYETDWWSLGIVIFESFYGEPPFYAESLVETYYKIMNHKIHFMFPENAKVTDEAKDLISNLITDRNSRYKTIDQFKAHPWFTGIDWEGIRDQVPPYKPSFDGPEDTSNFDISDLKPMNNNALNQFASTKEGQIELSFVGFSATFTANSQMSAIQPTSTIKPETPATEKSQPNEDNEIVEKIRSSAECDSEKKIQQLEERLKSAQKEWGEMSHLLTEMKKEKNELSTKLRTKEEELDEQIEKNSQLRVQLRNYEKNKRQNLEDITTLHTELEAQKILRKQDQNLIHDYEERLELLECKLKNDTESSKLLTNEKQIFLTQINNFEQQILKLEEENISLKEQNKQLKKDIGEINSKVGNMNKYMFKAETDLQDVLGLVSQEQLSRGRMTEVLDTIETNARKAHERINGTRSMDIDTISRNSIKNSSSSWQERRMARVEKQELLTLQVQLNNEIAVKQKAQSELARLQQEFDKLNNQLNEAQGEIGKLRKQVKSKSHDSSSNSARFAESDGESNMFLKDNFFEQNTLLLVSNNNNNNTGGSGSRGGGGDNNKMKLQLRQPPASTPTAGSRLSEVPSTSNMDNFDYQDKHGHSFIIRTFITPIKCYICTSLMIGLVRQGYVCEVCGYACHVGCVDLGLPCPFDETKQRMVGIDPQKGIGTAYEGYVKIPKPRGGIRKGWVRMFVVVCDFKLFLYDTQSDSLSSGLNYGNLSNMDASLMNTPSVSANTIIDMRDENFSVSDVTESDVIHASPKDIPCIFRITTSMIGEGLQLFTQLMLVDKETEKHKWIDALRELHRIIRRNNIPTRNTLRCYNLLNTLQISSLRHTDNVYCCSLIDETRLLIGCEDSLVCCDLDINSYHRLTNSKRFLQIAYIQSEQLIVALSGKQKQIKLIPMRALDNENIDWIKINESKNATTFTVAYHNQTAFVCVAIRKTLHIFEITHKKARFQHVTDMQMPVNIQTLNTCLSSYVAVGTNSNYLVYHVAKMEQPLYLVNQDSMDLAYLIHNPIDPLLCLPVDENEWLLVFVHYGVYVDNYGKRSRCTELQYPSQPQYASVLSSSKYGVKYLLSFSNTHIDVFSVTQTEWVQTINLKATKPLQTFGENVIFCITNALDLPNLVQIVIEGENKIKVFGDNIKAFTLTNLNQRNQQTGNEMKRNTKIQISAPTDFSHVSHLGPGSGPFSSNLIDLNAVKDTLDKSSSKESMSKSSTHSFKN